MPPRGSSPEPVVGMGLGRSWSIISNQGTGRDVPTAGTARRGQEGLASELLKSSLLLGGKIIHVYIVVQRICDIKICISTLPWQKRNNILWQ